MASPELVSGLIFLEAQKRVLQPKDGSKHTSQNNRYGFQPLDFSSSFAFFTKLRSKMSPTFLLTHSRYARRQYPPFKRDRRDNYPFTKSPLAIG